MKLCIVGAGAIGGQLAVRLARSGAQVSLLVRREAQRAAIAAHGLKLLLPEGEMASRDLAVATDCAALGPQDLVILALKAHQVRAVVPAVRSLFGAETMLLSLQNGIPWWYFQRHGGPFEGRRLAALDPDGAISAAIEPGRIIGAVAYIAGEAVELNAIRHGGGDRLPIGELDGGKSARIEQVAALFETAGIRSPVVADIRAEQWFKIWANSCINPLGALTRCTIGEMVGRAEGRALLLAMMEEIAAVAGRLGVAMRGTIEARVAILDKVAGHRTSMLQDVEAGRPLEIDALLGALVELAALTGLAAPHLRTVYACAKLLDRVST